MSMLFDIDVVLFIDEAIAVGLAAVKEKTENEEMIMIYSKYYKNKIMRQAVLKFLLQYYNDILAKLITMRIVNHYKPIWYREYEIKMKNKECTKPMDRTIVDFMVNRYFRFKHLQRINPEEIWKMYGKVMIDIELMVDGVDLAYDEVIMIKHGMLAIFFGEEATVTHLFKMNNFFLWKDSHDVINYYFNAVISLLKRKIETENFALQAEMYDAQTRHLERTMFSPGDARYLTMSIIRTVFPRFSNDVDENFIEFLKQVHLEEIGNVYHDSFEWAISDYTRGLCLYINGLKDNYSLDDLINIMSCKTAFYVKNSWHFVHDNDGAFLKKYGLNFLLDIYGLINQMINVYIKKTKHNRYGKQSIECPRRSQLIDIVKNFFCHKYPEFYANSIDTYLGKSYDIRHIIHVLVNVLDLNVYDNNEEVKDNYLPPTNFFTSPVQNFVNMQFNLCET